MRQGAFNASLPGGDIEKSKVETSKVEKSKVEKSKVL